MARHAALTRRSLLAGFAAAGASFVAAACAAVPSTPAPAATAVAAPPAAPTAAPGTVAGASRVFQVGVSPTEDADAILKRYNPLFEFLKAEMDTEVKGFVGTDYSSIIEALKAQRIDAAFFGPFPYVLAADVAGARVVVMRGNPDGSKGTYRSLIIANKKSGVTRLDDLKGKTFAFVDPASASGHLIPRALLVKAGIDPDKDLKALFAGGHDAALLAIHSDKVDAGAVADSFPPRMAEAKQVDPANLVTVATSDPIPNGPVATRAGLDPGVRDRFRDALLRAHTKLPAELVKAVLGGEKNRFVPAEDADFDPLRETARVLNLDLRKLE